MVTSPCSAPAALFCWACTSFVMSLWWASGTAFFNFLSCLRIFRSQARLCKRQPKKECQKQCNTRSTRKKNFTSTSIAVVRLHLKWMSNFPLQKVTPPRGFLLNLADIQHYCAWCQPQERGNQTEYSDFFKAKKAKKKKSNWKSFQKAASLPKCVNKVTLL